VHRVVKANERKLIAISVPFDPIPFDITRAEFADHPDEIHRELGLHKDRVIKLKLPGAVIRVIG
jgi:hypothetical protein